MCSTVRVSWHMTTKFLTGTLVHSYTLKIPPHIERRRGLLLPADSGRSRLFPSVFLSKHGSDEAHGNRELFSIRAGVVKRFQANNSNFCRSRARASLRDQPLALPAWDQQEETEQSDLRTDRGRAIDTRVQSELVSSIVPRGTSLRWIVAPTVWRSSLRLSAPFPLSSGTRFHHSTCDA